MALYPTDDSDGKRFKRICAPRNAAPSTLDRPAEDPPRRLFDLPPDGIPFTEEQQRLELVAALLGAER